MIRPSRASSGASPAETEAVWAALSGLVMETMMFHRQWARRQGLTALQFMVLKTLDREGPLQPSQIADRFGISRSAVSSEFNTLEAGRWILRTHPTGNRRTRLTSLTPKAHRVRATAGREYRARVLEALGDVPAGQRGQLAETITALVARLRDHRADDPSGPLRNVP
jgi:DNA-binding MarR family transcriptional regulator